MMMTTRYFDYISLCSDDFGTHIFAYANHVPSKLELTLIWNQKNVELSVGCDWQVTNNLIKVVRNAGTQYLD